MPKWQQLLIIFSYIDSKKSNQEISIKFKKKEKKL